MPQVTNQKKSTRTPVDSAQFFRKTTPRSDVVARPVDAMEEQGQGGGQWASALQSINSGVSSFTNIADEINKKEREKGKVAAIANPDAMNLGGKSRAFWEGMESVRGEKVAKVDLTSQLRDYFNENKDLPSDEFMAGYEAISRDHLNNRSEAFMRAYAPVALELDSTLMQEYNAHQLKMKMTEMAGNVNQTMAKDLKLSIDRIGEHGDPAVFKAEMVEDLEGFIASHPHLPPRQIMKMFSENLNRYAIEYGVHELLDYADVEIAGVQLSSDPEFQKDILDARHSAKELARIKAERADTERRRKRSEQREEDTKTALVNYYKLDEVDTKGAAAMFHELSKKPDAFETSSLSLMLRGTKEILQGGGFRKVDNYEKTFPVLEQLMSGDVLGDDGFALIAKNAEHFSPNGRKEAMRLVEDMKSYTTSPEGRAELQYFKDARSELKGLIAGSDMSKFQTPRLRELSGMGVNAFNAWRRFVKTTTGSFPTEEAVDKKKMEISKMYREMGTSRDKEKREMSGDEPEVYQSLGIGAPKEKPKEKPKETEPTKTDKPVEGTIVWVLDPKTGKPVPQKQ